MDSEPPTRLNPSDLGSKQHWDQVYARELENHASNPDDEGTIWFDDTGAEEKVLDYLERLKVESSGTEENAANAQLRLLDLGTGNGHMLFELKDEGWQAEMVGVDYSESSIELAKQIQQRRADPSEPEDDKIAPHAPQDLINFQRWDILNDDPGEWLKDCFDIVLDKGTFDAICLQDNPNSQGRRLEDVYFNTVLPLIRDRGYLIVTSCNWTEEELKEWFHRGELRYYDSLKYPTFTFAGVKGQSISSLCFKRQSGG